MRELNIVKGVSCHIYNNSSFVRTHLFVTDKLNLLSAGVSLTLCDDFYTHFVIVTVLINFVTSLISYAWWFSTKVTSCKLCIDFSVIFILEHVHFLTSNVCQMEIPLKSCARSLMNLSLPSEHSTLSFACRILTVDNSTAAIDLILLLVGNSSPFLMARDKFFIALDCALYIYSNCTLIWCWFLPI